MRKKTDDLLAKAKSMNDASLTDAIEALEFLGDEATANHQESKDLEALVEKMENEPTAKTTTKQATVKTSDAAAEAVEKVAEIAEEAKDAAYKAAMAEKAVDATIKDELEKGEKAIAEQEGIPAEDVSLEPHSKTQKSIDPVFARDKSNLKYADIKMIGNMFYSRKDNYTVGFATADECAACFNEAGD